MRSVFLAAALVLGLSVPAAAHDAGVVRLDTKTLAAGGELGIRGEKFGKRVPLQLELRGTLKKYLLKEVETDTAGKFALKVALPADAKPGKYTVVAVAIDGDDAGQATLVVTAASAAGQAMPGMPPGMGDHMMPTAGQGGMPTAAEMKLEVSTSPAERAVIVALITLGLAGGSMLLVLARRSEG